MERNGEFKVKKTKSHDLEIHIITIPHKKWKLEISVSDTRPLRFECPFSAAQDFMFQLGRKDPVDRLLMLFSNKGVKVGWREFDHRFSLSSNRPDLVKRVMTTEIQQVILSQDVYSLSHRTDMKNRTARLTGVIQRRAGNKEKNQELITAFLGLIDRLEDAGAIK